MRGIRHLYPLGYNFGERLRHLMELRGFDMNKKSFPYRRLAEAMINTGYFPMTDSESLVKDSDTKTPQQKQVDNITKTIQRHALEYENPEQVEAGYIIAYCDFFNCDADYILGYTDNITREITDVNAYTGLTEKSIIMLNRLNKIRNTNGKNLNHLIRDYAVRQSSENIDSINMILEQGINNWDKSSILSMIYEYVKTKDNPCFVYAEAINEYDEEGEIIDTKTKETELDTSNPIDAGIYIRGASIGNFEVDLKKYYPAIFKDVLIQEIEKLK